MAKKKSKGSKKAANHGKNLAGAMKSVSTSTTPISALYPKKVTVGSSKTSPRHMQSATKTPSRSAMPQKFLLSITNPGAQPEAPTPVNNPGTLASPANADLYASYGKKGWNKMAKSYKDDQKNLSLAISAYNTYLTNLATYQDNLSAYNTRLANYNRDTAANNKKTTQYSRDVAKFVRSLDRKAKVSVRKSKLAGGSRSGRSKPGGSR